MPNTAIGTGTVVEFTTSGFVADLLGVSWSQSRESIQASHMGTTGQHEFIPVDLSDGGEISMDIAFDADDTPPIDLVPETVTITFPLKTGTTPATWSATCFCTSFDLSDPFEDKMTASLTLKVSGATTITPET